jgi:hypothetical protein
LKDEGLFLLSVPYTEHVQEHEEPVGVCKARERAYICIGEGGSHCRDGYNLDRMQTLLENNGFTMIEWEYLCFPGWLESSIISFTFRFPLSLLFTHFRRNRLKFKTIAKKVTPHPASVDKAGRF